ncbi:MAG: M1 family metallopeptidase, partial [Sphingomonas sp.]
TQPTRTLTLNAADLVISGATIDGAAATSMLDATSQQLSVTAPKLLGVGTHTLHLNWTGKINDTAAGFFAIDYKNPDGSAARMLVTQFEAPDARRFAPMWDEPSYKATFRLTTTVPAGQTAFSNMPVASRAKGANGKQAVTFATSPVMSSYLLFLGIGDVERKTVMAGKTEIGIITRRGVVDRGDYALAQAKRLLAYYNDYFGQPYPLPKLDMIAGPGSSQFFGAMENWGAIFYFEPTVLFDAKRGTQSSRQEIFGTVAHEMAHQWFGDLVTMKWWDDLWLNEGFASWMANKAAIDLNPEWQQAAAAVVGSREGAFGADATAATHPIIRHVETVDQIGEGFDAITYSKGEAVIGMIESTIAPDIFRDGIRRYMAKYRYNNTETDQLWTDLSAAAGRPVTDIAHDFTLQAGVPLVSVVSSQCGNGTTTVTLQNGRYGLDQASKAPQQWTVPLRLATLGGKVTTSAVKSDAPYTVQLAGCGPVIANLGKGSYARVRYDAASHAALVAAYPRLDLVDRVGTIADDFGLALSGDQPLTAWADTIGAVRAEAEPIEWITVDEDFASLRSLFYGTPQYAKLQARTITTFAPVLARLGYEARPGESTQAANLREGLVASLGIAGDPDVAARARAYAAKLASDPTAIPPAIRDAILTTYSINATQAEWDALLAVAKAERDPVVKNAYINLLGGARDEAVARGALGLLEGNTLTAPQKAALLQRLSGRHADMAFDWAVAHPAIVESFLETSSRAGYVVRLGASSTDPA